MGSEVYLRKDFRMSCHTLACWIHTQFYLLRENKNRFRLASD